MKVTKSAIEQIKHLPAFVKWSGRGVPGLELTKQAAGFLTCSACLEGTANARRLEIEKTLYLLKADELGILNTVNPKRTYGEIKKAIKEALDNE